MHESTWHDPLPPPPPKQSGFSSPLSDRQKGNCATYFHPGVLLNTTSQRIEETLPNVAQGVDVHSYRVPLGVCAGIAPFNFPAMIPLWMLGWCLYLLNFWGVPLDPVFGLAPGLGSLQRVPLNDYPEVASNPGIRFQALRGLSLPVSLGFHEANTKKVSKWGSPLGIFHPRNTNPT